MTTNLPTSNERWCPCGRSDAEHDPTACERQWNAEQQTYIEEFGPCGYHDYGVLTGCNCSQTPARFAYLNR